MRWIEKTGQMHLSTSLAFEIFFVIKNTLPMTADALCTISLKNFNEQMWGGGRGGYKM
jgi:hypothetical protein